MLIEVRESLEDLLGQAGRADAPEMVVIRAGRFRMGRVSGRGCFDVEQPVHEVTVASFALSKYEVTFEEYDRFTAATGGARAGTGTAYSWGNEIGTNRANCDGCGSQWDDAQTAPVGSFGANAWGLHDMHGNVWEWVEDCWHENYAGAPSDGTAWTSVGNCSERVLRGGSWFIFPGFLLRVPCGPDAHPVSLHGLMSGVQGAPPPGRKLFESGDRS